MQERQGNTIGQARIAACIVLTAGHRQAQVTPLDPHDPRLGQVQQRQRDREPLQPAALVQQVLGEDMQPHFACVMP